MPAVSVIIPTLNRNALLQEAVQSVLRQSFPDFDVIVVDDGSEPEVEPTCVANGDERIQVVRQAHRGRSAARNRGLAMAKGKYIALLDDDDAYLPQKLEVQVAYLEQHPHAAVVSGGARYVDERGCEMGDFAPWEEGYTVTFRDALYGTRMVTSSVLFRRELLDTMSEWFDPEMDLAEDGDFFVRLIHSAGEATVLPVWVSLYRLRGNDRAGGGPAASAGYRRVLDKAYELPGLPDDILRERPRVYAHLHMVCGCRAYAVQDAEHGREQLNAALELDAAYVEAELPAIIPRFAGFRMNDPRPYIEYLIDNLPPALASISSRKKESYRAFLARHARSLHTVMNEG